MQIRAIHVRGFGHFYNFTIEKLPTGLTLITGPNEAGKTTLLSFIRAIFFGFPDRRSGLKRYEPVEGGEHGGSITLTAADGTVYRVERTPGAARGNVVVYHRTEVVHVKGTDHSELANSKERADNAVATRGEKVTHGEVEIQRLLKGLSEPLFQQIFCFGLDELQRLDNLQNDEISGLIYSAGMGLHTRSYAQMQKDLTKKLDDLYRPQGKKPELNLLVLELADVDAQIAHLKDNPLLYNRCKLAMEELTAKISTAEEQLDEKDAEERWFLSLAQANEPYRRFKQAKEELAGLAQIVTFPADGLGRLEVLKDTLGQEKSLLNRLELEREAVREELQELKIDQVLLHSEPQIQELLEETRLFQKWQSDILTLKVQLTQKAKEIKQFLQNLGPGWTEERVSNFSLTLARRRQAQEFLHTVERLTETARVLSAEEKQMQREVEEREREVREVTGLAETSTDLPGTIHTAGRSRLDAAPEKTPTRQTWKKDHKLSSQVFTFGALISGVLIFGGIAACVLSAIVSGILLLGTGLAILFGTIYLKRLLAQHENTAKDRQNAEITARQEALLRSRHQLGEHQKRQEEQRQAWENHHVQWRNFLQKEGLPIDLEPADLPDLFNLLEKGQELLQSYRETLQTYREIEKQSRTFLFKANALLEKLQRIPAEPTDVKGFFYNLKTEIEMQQSMYRTLQHLEEKLRDLDLKKSDLTYQYNATLDELTRLLKEGGTVDEEDFRRRGQIYAKRMEVLQTLKEREVTFGMLAAAKSEEMAAQLEILDMGTIEEKLASARAERLRAKAEIDGWREELGRLQKTVATFEESADAMGLLQQQRESLIEQIKVKSEEWMAVAFCQRFLELAKERYEEERQPGVLKEATQLFSDLTRGRYRRIISPLGEDHLEVERHDGKRMTTDELSRGTAEQLYLAMRLALAKEYSERTLALPLIMDDILVNFDLPRTEAALEVLAKFAEHRQILFFTCHHHLVQLLRRQNLPFNHLEI